MVRLIIFFERLFLRFLVADSQAFEESIRSVFRYDCVCDGFQLFLIGGVFIGVHAPHQNCEERVLFRFRNSDCDFIKRFRVLIPNLPFECLDFTPEILSFQLRFPMVIYRGEDFLYFARIFFTKSFSRFLECLDYDTGRFVIVLSVP